MKKNILFVSLLALGLSAFAAPTAQHKDVVNADTQRKEVCAAIDALKMKKMQKEKINDKEIKALEKEYTEFVQAMETLKTSAAAQPELWREVYSRTTPWGYVVKDMKSLTPLTGKKETLEFTEVDYSSLKTEAGNEIANLKVAEAKKKLASSSVDEQNQGIKCITEAEKTAPQRKQELHEMAAEFLMTRANSLASSSEMDDWTDALKDYRETNIWVPNYKGCQKIREDLSEKMQNQLWTMANENMKKENLEAQLLGNKQLNQLQGLYNNYQGLANAMKVSENNLSVYLVFVDQNGKLVVPKMTKETIKSLTNKYRVKLLNPGTVELFKDLTIKDNSSYKSIEENLGCGFVVVKMGTDFAYTFVDARVPAKPEVLATFGGNTKQSALEDDATRRVSDIVAVLDNMKFKF